MSNNENEIIARPDLALAMLRHGIGNETVVGYSSVEVSEIRVLQNGLFTTTMHTDFEGRSHSLFIDFGYDELEQMLVLGPAENRRAIQDWIETVPFVDQLYFPHPIEMGLFLKFREEQATDDGSFVPMTVTRIYAPGELIKNIKQPEDEEKAE